MSNDFVIQKQQEEVNKAIKRYEEHIELGMCSAGPEDGCLGCLEAMQAGVIQDYIPEFTLGYDIDFDIEI